MPDETQKDLDIELLVVNGSDDNEQVHYENFTKKQVIIQTLHASWPLIAAYTCVNLRDFISPRILRMVLENDAVASYSLISVTQSLVVFTFHGPLYYISALTAQKFGFNDKNSIGIILRQSIVLGIIFSVPASVLFSFSGPILSLFGQSDLLLKNVDAYFKGYVFGLPAIAATTCITQFLTGIKKQRHVLAFSALILLIDIILKYIFTLGLVSTLTSGAFGLGLANSLQSWIGVIVCLLYFYLKNDFRNYNIFKIDFGHIDTIKLILKKGAPISFYVTGRFIASFFTTLFIGKLGKMQLSVHQTAAEYLYLSSPVRLGLGDASEALVGHYFGKKDLIAARNFGNMTIYAGIFFSLAMLIVLSSFPNQLASFFINTNTDESIGLVIFVFVVNAFLQVFDTIRDISMHALRGLNETTYPTIATLVSALLIGLPLSFFAYLLDLKLEGITIATGIGITVNSIMVGYQWLSKHASTENINPNCNCLYFWRTTKKIPLINSNQINMKDETMDEVLATEKESYALLSP